MENKTTFSTMAIGLKVFYIGMLVGTFDILAALTNYYISTGKNPMVIFKYISSGILGTDAFAGGTAIILMGLLLHYIIALSFTILFCILYYHIKSLSNHKIFTGIVYGIFIWAIMNLIVVPLSHTPKSPFDTLHAVKELLILIFMIGLPLSFLTGRFIFKPRT
ncbi:hypothetical protein [Olivibacter domesticus]|uniref:DUF1440 domain-containing protein n=1 Tax=Olivibacter domesticus TaxID=407022 RepID=A0A1H7HIG1_OLID1|nr:hypothetical protein [Olivibacter domesticus]SEK49447.1 hypothetical protein SAMN05661044_00376 [Olivibacter domesticus]